MRFVEKKESPAFFENLKEKYQLNENKTWGDFKGKSKKALTEILRQEQCCLCIYCECFLPDDDDSCYEELEKQLKKDNKNVKSSVGGDNRNCTHIEHLKPKKMYKNLMFSYENLTLSCQGVDDKEKMKIESTCGHSKDEKFDENLFISPVAVTDIDKYFSYDEENGSIKPSGLGGEKANYMIKLLKLDSEHLSVKRSTAKRAIEEVYKSVPYDQQLDVLKKELASNREYISFLRYCFSVT